MAKLPRKSTSPWLDMYTSDTDIRFEQNWLCLFALDGGDENPKIYSYDLKLLIETYGIGSLFARGTILKDDPVVITFMLFANGLALLSASCSALVYDADLVDVENLPMDVMITYLNKFVPFVLGLYLSLCVERWWAMREEAIGKVLSSLANVAMVIHVFLKGEHHRAAKEQVHRYGMASIALVVQAAHDEFDLDELVKTLQLTDEEARVLQKIDLFQRPMVLWTWIHKLTFEEMRDARVDPPLMQIVSGACISAREGIQTIHTYLETQLPLAYVHIIQTAVCMNTIIVAVNAGIALYSCYVKSNFQEGLQQLLMLNVIPYIYHGLVSVTNQISDPFGPEMSDFPISAFQMYVAECCRATSHAEQCFPGAEVDPTQVRRTQQAAGRAEAEAPPRPTAAPVPPWEAAAKASHAAPAPSPSDLASMVLRISEEIDQVRRAFVESDDRLRGEEKPAAARTPSVLAPSARGAPAPVELPPRPGTKEGSLGELVRCCMATEASETTRDHRSNGKLASALESSVPMPQIRAKKNVAREPEPNPEPA